MNPNAIREFAASFQKSRILLSGFELDIFTNIEESGTTNNQIANNLHLDKHACERLLNALVSLGFLTKQNHVFFNTAESFTFLSKKSSNYLGGLMHTNHLWNTWSHLTQVVKTGNSAHASGINERGEEWLSPFITAMHDRAIKQAPIQLANIDLSGILSVLDIGGGSGAYSMEFVSKKPEIEATVFAKNMLVGTEGGDCFTEQEVTEMLTAAGFENISRVEFETGLSQMMAQKV
jgi:hypothetical protein